MPADTSRLRIVFFGTSAFALPALRILANTHDICVVITQPDRPAGRGQKMTPTVIRREAEKIGLRVSMPTKLREEVPFLEALQPDAFVVASYGRILPESLLQIPQLGAFNIHPSQLPLYRGASPITAPIRDGRTTTATTIIHMDAGLDTGDILVQECTPIHPDETGSALHDRLAERGAVLLLEALRAAAHNELVPRPQAGLADEAEVTSTLTKPMCSADLLVDWQWPAKQIVDHVRAYALEPTARAWLAGQRVKLLVCGQYSTGDLVNSSHRQTASLPGTLLAEHHEAVLVACGDGVVRVSQLIPPGRSPQSGAEFARRYRTESP